MTDPADIYAWGYKEGFDDAYDGQPSRSGSPALGLDSGDPATYRQGYRDGYGAQSSIIGESGDE